MRRLQFLEECCFVLNFQNLKMEFGLQFRIAGFNADVLLYIIIKTHIINHNVMFYNVSGNLYLIAFVL